MKNIFGTHLFRTFIPLLVLCCSVIYAWSLVPTQVVFGYDQARDAYEAYAIWHDHDIKILGPKTDIPGVHHGVLWYYVLALFYFFGEGIPENASYLLIVALSLSLPAFWYFAYKMSKSILVAWVTIILYAMSPYYIAFTHWLSNPVLALFLTPPLLYLLWHYIHNQKILKASVIGLLYGLLVQTNFAFIVLLLVLPLYYRFFTLRFLWSHLGSFLAGFLLAISTILLSYIKFDTNILGILAHFLNSSAHGISAGVSTLRFVDNIIQLFTFTYLPLPILLTLFLLIFLGIYYRKIWFGRQDSLSKFLLIWLSGGLFMFFLNRGDLLHSFFYGIFLYPLALFFIINLRKIVRPTGWFVLVISLIFVLQVTTTQTWIANGKSLLSLQNGMTTYYEKQVIDYVYTSAANQPFVITTITNPLYINTTWSYVFTIYGKEKYGYLPYFWGKDQVGYLGNLPKQENLNFPKERYLIMESVTGIDERWINHSLFEEDLLSDIVEEKKFGEFTVQKRLFHPDKKPASLPKE